MRGSVLLVVASLGLATVVSMLLWVARKITWRRPAPFLRQLEAVSGAPERSGPASGISRLDPMKSGNGERAGEDTDEDAPPDAPQEAPPDAPQEAPPDAPAVTER